MITPNSTPARYYDGLSAESRGADVHVDATGVHVEVAPGDARIWPFDELVLVRGDGRGEPVQIERRSTPVEVLLVEDRAFLTALRAALPRGRRLAGSGGFRFGVRTVAMLIAAATLLVFAAWRFGVPALADQVAQRVPVEWEREFGDQVVADFAPPAQRVTDPAIIAPAQSLHRRFAATEPGAGAPSRLVVARNDLVNAFAAPGGAVVITTGLLRTLRTPDELAAVLAHEVGHVHRRHPLRGALRQVSLLVLLGMIAGDQSLLGTALQAAGQLGGLSYSREYEREADDEAISLLAREGVSPVALANALETIRRAAPAGVEIGFLSTHPAPAERVARILRWVGTTPVRAAPSTGVTAEDWRVMKAALDTPGKAKATR